MHSTLTFAGLVSRIITLINDFLLPIVVGLAFLAFFIGVGRFIFSAGDSGHHESGKMLMVWGLVALFVMFSIWGILQILTATFFPGVSL